MAAAAKAANAQPLGVRPGPNETVLVESTNIDVDSTIDFTVAGHAQAVEVSIVSATAATASPSVVFTLQGWNAGSQTWEDLLASSALAAAGSKALIIGLNIVASANVAAQKMPREKMRLKIDYTGTPVTDVLNGVTVTARSI